MEQQNDKLEINLPDLLHYLKKKFWIVAVAVVLCLAGCWAYFRWLSVPQYTASTQMYVLNRRDGFDVGSADFQISNYVVNDYKVLITGRNVTKKVVEQLGLSMSPDSLARKIEVISTTNTRVLQINVTDVDPQRAADIANMVYEVAAVQIQAIMEVDAVKLVSPADVPLTPSGLGMRSYLLGTAAIGFLMSLGVLTGIYVVDDTIRTEVDVERYLGLHVWGVIPEVDDLKSGHEDPGKRKRFLVMKGNGRR